MLARPIVGYSTVETGRHCTAFERCIVPRYDVNMVGLLVLALIVSALWFGSSLMKKLNNAHE